MTPAIADPLERMLMDAADLITAQGWDPLADAYPSEENGALSVQGALAIACQKTDGGGYPGDALDLLASYLTDTVLIPIHAVMVGLCPQCQQCRKHTDRPLTLIKGQSCPEGCSLCDEHADLSNPYGPNVLLSEEVVICWESLMPHRRDVISGLRAAASRPVL